MLFASKTEDSTFSLYALGAQKCNRGAGQGRVYEKSPGRRVAFPYQADEHGESGAGKGYGNTNIHVSADTIVDQGLYLDSSRLHLTSPPCPSVHQAALLEEQKLSAEERRKLAAEWAHFHVQEKERRRKLSKSLAGLQR